ncbi:hypothetical protein R3P38DRAFT_2805686 [Favolaschia claudopus]|uniref:Uncharacterized protein n=1 Tax=Favolaschia claudopus TaxID=2862362 RepID=A0AAV9ZMA6_9AGAR
MPNQVHRAKWKAHDPQDGPVNHTVFLRGWTVTLSPQILIESAAWPNTTWCRGNSELLPGLQNGNFCANVEVPSATVVLSHDEDWCTILEKESALALPYDLVERIKIGFSIAVEDDTGAAFLVPKETSSNEQYSVQNSRPFNTIENLYDDNNDDPGPRVQPLPPGVKLALDAFEAVKGLDSKFTAHNIRSPETIVVVHRTVTDFLRDFGFSLMYRKNAVSRRLLSYGGTRICFETSPQST